MVKYTKKVPNILLTNFQKADVLKTHGDNKKIKRYLNYYKFTGIEDGMKKTYDWIYDNLTKNDPATEKFIKANIKNIK